MKDKELILEYIKMDNTPTFEQFAKINPTRKELLIFANQLEHERDSALADVKKLKHKIETMKCCENCGEESASGCRSNERTPDDRCTTINGPPNKWKEKG